MKNKWMTQRKIISTQHKYNFIEQTNKNEGNLWAGIYLNPPGFSACG